MVKNNSWCKACKRQYYQDNKEKYKLYDIANKDKKQARNCQYYIDNIDHVKQYRKDNIDSFKAYMKEYREINRIEINEYKKEYENNRWKTDLDFKLKKLVSSSIYDALQKANSSKNGYSCFDFLGYTIQELKSHIEQQFESWMTWDNQGRYLPKNWKDDDQTTWTWNIDHIIPKSKFKYQSMNDEEFRKCWALNNLRPYSAKQNVMDKDNR